MMGSGLDKITQEYLYLKCTTSMDIPFQHVRGMGFRTFLEYIDPVAQSNVAEF